MTIYAPPAARQHIYTRIERVVADFLCGRPISRISTLRRLAPDHIKRILRSQGYDPDNQVAALAAENARLRAALAEREAA